MKGNNVGLSAALVMIDQRESVKTWTSSSTSKRENIPSSRGEMTRSTKLEPVESLRSKSGPINGISAKKGILWFSSSMPKKFRPKSITDVPRHQTRSR